MRAGLKWLTQDWTLKLAGVGIALLLWSVVKSEDVVTVDLGSIPVQVSVRDPGWELDMEPVPRTVTLEVTGPVREVLHLLVNRPRLVVPVEDVADSVQVLVLRSGWVQFPEDVVRTRVEDLRPATVRLVFDRVAARMLRVWLPVRGELPSGLVLTGVRLDPESVRVSGPRRRIARFDSIALPALDLRHITDTTTITMDIDTAVLGLQVRPSTVRVRVAVGPPRHIPRPPAVDTARVDSLLGVPQDSLGQDTIHASGAAHARAITAPPSAPPIRPDGSGAGAEPEAR